jgi:hypothetical protein
VAEQDGVSQADINSTILVEAGGNLRFLEPFLSATESEPGWTWEKAYNAFRRSEPCRNARKRLQHFLTRRGREHCDVLTAWLECVGGVRVRDLETAFMMRVTSGLTLTMLATRYAAGSTGA